MTNEPGPDRTAALETIAIEVAGTPLELRVFDDPSGLRGQVFRGHEKLAGVQIYHSDDRDALIEQARRNPAVLRSVGA